MAKRPTIRKFENDDNAQAAVEEVTDQLAKDAPVQIKPKKKKAGRPRKYDHPTKGVMVYLEHDLLELVKKEAEATAAGNMSVTASRLIAKGLKK